MSHFLKCLAFLILFPVLPYAKVFTCHGAHQEVPSCIVDHYYDPYSDESQLYCCSILNQTIDSASCESIFEASEFLSEYFSYIYSCSDDSKIRILKRKSISHLSRAAQQLCQGDISLNLNIYSVRIT